MGKNLKGKELGKGLGQRKDGLYYARCRNYRGERVRNAASRPCQKPKIGDRNSSIYAYTLKVGLWHRPI